MGVIFDSKEGEMSKRANDKGEKKGGVPDFVQRVIIFCLIGIIIVSGYKVFSILSEYRKASKAYDKISEIAKAATDTFTGEIDWKSLLQINPEVEAWIYLEDSTINYPVAKAADNDYYLHRLIDETYNYSGTIFVDYRCEDDFAGFNTILYGHHMKDGSMFAGLKKFVNESGYAEKHNKFELITPDEKYHLMVFSAYVADATGDTYTLSFDDESEEAVYISNVLSKSTISTENISVTADDRIVTLSTCVNAEGDARYVVHGKMVPWTDAEKAEAKEAQKKIDAQG